MDAALPATCNSCDGDGLCGTCKGYGSMLVRQSWEVRASTDARCRTCDGVGLIYTPSTYAVDGRRLSIPSPCPRCGVLMACVTCTGDGACSFCRGTGLVDA